LENLSDPCSTPDWTQLQHDLLVHVFSQLELPELVYLGAPCSSWCRSYLAVRHFRLFSSKQSPYLVHSSADRGGNVATLHNISTNKAYHVPLPDPPFRSQFVVGSSHGWLVTADERSNLHLLNPFNGSQLDLSPPQSIKGVRVCFGDGGAVTVEMLCVKSRRVNSYVEPRFFPPEKTRLFLFERVVLSGDPSSATA
jgi:hypothetical protein